MKIAVASQNFRTVTSHAGRTRRFLVFDAEPGGVAREVARLDMPQDMALHNFQGTGDHPLYGMDAIIAGSAIMTMTEGPRMTLRACFVAAALIAVASPAVAADLKVSIANVSSAGGSVYVGLYDSDDTFRDPDRARAGRVVPAAPGTVSVDFQDVQPGTYAVMAYHDENGDGQLNRFLGMIPTEGYALSNDPEVSGPPPFADSAFEVPERGAEVGMTMRY